MEDSDLTKITEAVTEQIIITVNGKLDKQHGILERQNEVMNGLIQKLDAHIEQHDKDNDALKPIIENFNNWSSFRKILFSIFLPLIAVLGALGGVGQFLDLFKK